MRHHLFFSAWKQMPHNTLLKHFILCVLLLAIVRGALIGDSTPTQQTVPAQNAIFMSTVSRLNDLSSSSVILSQLGVPGFSRKHGFNYIVLDGWTCNGSTGLPLSFWKNPNAYINTTLGESDDATRKVIKQFYQAAGVKLLVNAFGSNEKPVSGKLDAGECASELVAFLHDYGFDGANIDLQEGISGDGIGWITRFTLSLNGKNAKQYIFSHSVDIDLFDQKQNPTGDYTLIEKAVGKHIHFYNIRYVSLKSSFTNYKEIFSMGTLSVVGLAKRGFPLNKIIIGKPSLHNQSGYVSPGRLIYDFRRANARFGWWGGAAFSPYIDQQAQDQTRQVTLRRDNIEPISATNLDSVNFWWPPEKTVGDLGVPGYSPNNMYNTFIFGVWTCKAGAFDVSRLWNQASFYLSTTFGNTTQASQAFLKEKYESKGKNILVRAFGSAESPTSSNMDPSVCARGLAAFVKNNSMDGVDVSYQDNVAFNNAFAESWLISFTNTVRSLLPFHIVSHTIQDYHLDSNKYKGGSYTRVISTVGNLLDFYSITYYGQQHTAFTTYTELFEDSGAEFPNASVAQLVAQGFDTDKTVIGKPVRLFDGQGQGFIEAQALREIFLQANSKLGWKAGVSYSSYINDQDGKDIMMLLRGINKTDSKRLAYVDNVKKWWPPKDTLGQMGVPSLSIPNIYNYFAYSFWTCGKGPLGISKLYNDPVTFLGTELGKDKSQIQAYIKGLHSNASVKLLISAFGASEFPATDGLNAVECGKKMVEFMGSNLIDGIDVDFEDNEAFKNNTAEQWVNVFMRQVRKAYPFHIISHAPQAPYFDANYAKSGSYLTINKVTGKFIDFYNIQFYNQGITAYTTYEGLFVDSGHQNANTSVFQIIKQGIQPEKIVLGKPVTPEDAYNTGFVPSSTMKDLLRQAVNDPNNPGWTPSVMYWHYLSDLSGAIIAQTMNYQS